MPKPATSIRVPLWLKGLGWLAFSILALATLLVAARWLVMENGHKEAQLRVARLQLRSTSTHPVTPPPDTRPAAKKTGIPLSSIPHFGTVLTGDWHTWSAFCGQLDEMSEFLRSNRSLPFTADGRISFRTLLQNMGIAIVADMTEEEAAREYIKQADRFSPLLVQWREAVAAGPLDRDGFTPVGKYFHMSDEISKLLKTTALARMRCGLHQEAWDDLRTMMNANDRFAEINHPDGKRSGVQDHWIDYVTRLGMRHGSWTGDQMAELSSMIGRNTPLQEMLRDRDIQRKEITGYYADFGKNRERFNEAYLSTPSHLDQIANRVKLEFITDRQIRDNMDLELAEADQLDNLFDPDTGFFLHDSEAARNPPADSDGKSDTPDSFYFMIRDLRATHHHSSQSLLEQADDLIRDQAQNDQFRLALALETYRRKTGSYPDHLESISAQFPTGPPMDIATGQPYLYQKDTEGYTLWGTGIDGSSDGGNKDTDVVWKHRPAKTK